ncbi:Uncharacterised protein [Pseudomonas aeruginosa]|nr:Uncharacterised protein [Pseudomonas aeruginosa]
MDSVDSDAQRLLGLIVEAAQLDARQFAERHDLMRQASALLWWLEPDSPPARSQICSRASACR